MDSWSADLILSVLPFLSLKDLNRLSQASSRYYYLVYQYRRLRGPELVAVSSHTPGVNSRQKTAEQVTKEALSRLQTPPNLALGFSTRRSNTPALKLPLLLPSTTIALNAVSSSIQSNIDGQLECQSNTALLLASLPQAQIHSFCFEGGEIDVASSHSGPFQTLVQTLQSSPTEWKVFLVHVCGAGSNKAERFVTHLQAQFPQATIAGGICAHGSVSLPVDQVLGVASRDDEPTTPTTTLQQTLTAMRGMDLVDLYQRLGGGRPELQGRPKQEIVERVLETLRNTTHCLQVVEDGIFGVALGGEVPVRSIVSRGVKSLTSATDDGEDHHQPSSSSGSVPSTNFVIQNVEFHRPGDEQYLFRFQDPHEAPPYHLVRSVLDRNLNNKRLTPSQLVSLYGEPDLIGLQRPGEDGFELHMPHPISYNLNAFVFLAQGLGTERSLQDANLDLFDLDGGLCLKDVEAKMKSLQLATAGEQILGAVMYSCGARGPMAGNLIPERMADAQRFARVFPKIPLLGFYAGGEIGPLALAGRQSVFQAGNSTLQGFTAVFAVFIVPAVDLGTLQLDDCTENVQALVRERLSRST